MRIGLHDSDKTDFPNLAIMKISAWHKSQGDDVRWWIPLETYDRVYSSKVFTFTPENQYLPERIFLSFQKRCHRRILYIPLKQYKAFYCL